MPSKDFDDFTQWFQVAHVRRNGRPPQPNTIRSKRDQLSTICNVLSLSKTTDNVIQALSERENVETLLDALAVRHANSTTRGIMETLLSWLTPYAKALGHHLQVRPDDKPKSRFTPNAVTYSRDECEVLVSMSRAFGARWQLLMTTLVDSGCRVGEMTNIRYEDIHIDGKVPHITLPQTKSQKPQTLILSSRLAEMYSDKDRMTKLRTGKQNQFCKPVDEYVFPITPESVRQRMRAFCAKIEVPYKGLHTCRHSFATHKLEDGVPLQAVSAFLRHGSIATTDRFYNHVKVMDYARYMD